jgi:hypothetical protein
VPAAAAAAAAAPSPPPPPPANHGAWIAAWTRASSACAYRAPCIVYRVSCIASRPALHVLRALSPGRLTTALTGLHGPAAAQVHSPTYPVRSARLAIPATAESTGRFITTALASPASSHWHRLCACGRAMHTVVVASVCPSPPARPSALVPAAMLQGACLSQSPTRPAQPGPAELSARRQTGTNTTDSLFCKASRVGASNLA